MLLFMPDLGGVMCVVMITCNESLEKAVVID